MARRESHLAGLLVVSFEKVGLRSRVFEIPKIAQADANQPITLLPTEVHSFSQLKGDLRQFVAGGGRRTWRVAAGKNPELTGLQFENHRACYPRLFARGNPKFFCQAPYHWFGFPQWHVVLKGIFERN